MLLYTPDSDKVGLYEMKLHIYHNGFDQTSVGGTTGVLGSISYDFNLIVNPCIVESYFVSQDVEDMSYTIGSNPSEDHIRTYAFG